MDEIRDYILDALRAGADKDYLADDIIAQLNGAIDDYEEELQEMRAEEERERAEAERQRYAEAKKMDAQSIADMYNLFLATYYPGSEPHYTADNIIEEAEVWGAIDDFTKAVEKDPSGALDMILELVEDMVSKRS